jgi:hypothetical protein
VATSVENLLNAALRRIGYATPVGYIYEGSKAGRVALDVYGQTRDDLLKMKDWPFAARDVTLSANGQTPPNPWPYEYSWPSDCLKVRYVQPLALGVMPNLDPRPTLFTDYNDQRTSPPSKAILANISPATLVYTAQVTDPATWEPGFTEALIDELARRLVVALEGSTDLLKIGTAQADKDVADADMSQVNYPPPPTPDVVEGRRQ